jgi:exodeoxyribonuclease VII small subunit
MAKSNKNEVDNMTYEQAFAEIEAIVAKLEADSSSLEESLTLFERGQTLSKHCAALLDQAELRVKQLINDENIDVEAEV